ncbi:sulfide/dihydroorotate dehydrogenase-like FAD/NAD-binding protein [Pseudodesulfovibrio sediminis]|uniref:Oxidoreductase n=1 Tax=Pseudodesulfovibrio sediminis TaxID=2810563 RepID=A0ABN6EQE4_9BACT|nr:sulfide/dihydroorotate dehydrogenase-like FAD/NAD-binding protein [Pseudodesulfovibrio sediminis]BCS87630.1 oxidoreductase [Pseudodesulfovibrio sediminis]
MYRESTYGMLSNESKLLTPSGKNVRTARAKAPRLKCIDAGSDFCPCHLAEAGECLVCSVLRGESECNCDWTGTCILAQNGWLLGHGLRRESHKAAILSRKDVGQGTEILHIQTPPRLASQLTRPGSFVFVRAKTEGCFDIPLTVLKSFPARQEIVLAYTQLGPKTKALATCKDTLWLRGPYWNGIQGHQLVEDVRNERVILVLSGMAQVCGPNIARTLIRNGNRVSVIYGTKEYPFVLPFLQEVPAAYFINLTSRSGWQEIQSLLKQLRPYCVFSGGNDEQHALLKKAMSGLRLKPRIATSRTHTMCCGEGVCGACVTTANGIQVRTCKARLDPDEWQGKEDARI